MSPSTVYATSEGTKFAGDTDLVVVNCPTCHVTYAIPESLKRSALKWRGDRADGRGWKICCPMGHTWWYTGPSKEDRLRERVQLAEEAASRNAAQRDQARADAQAQKAAKTRIKNDRDRIKARVGAGVCPCCNRTFKQLARHMATKHPDYSDEA